MKKSLSPSSLFKYYALTNYNINAITKQYFYFSHPHELNDPFDAFFQRINLTRLTKEQMKSFYCKNFHFAFPNEPFSISKVHDWINRSFIAESTRKYFYNDTIPIYWNSIFSKVGILSMTEICDSMTIWSYYTNHFGFSVKYKNLLFDSSIVWGPFPIDYKEKYETIFPRHEDINVDDLICLLTTKSQLWERENEWRYVLKKENLHIPDYTPSSTQENNKVTYEIKQIDYITLAYKFFKANIRREHISDREHKYYFSDTDDDLLKIRLLNFIIENEILVKQVHTSEDNTFTLISFPIKIRVIEKDKIYLVETMK